MSGYLNKGGKIIVVFGDRSGSSPGWQMQTFCEDTFEFKILVDPIATYQFKEIPVTDIANRAGQPRKGGIYRPFTGYHQPRLYLPSKARG